MGQQDTIAVIGAGVIGAAAAFALAREGRQVLLLDRAEPGEAGASFGNAGHIAAELVQPLPSPGLLFGFYRELFRFGGALDLSPRQALRMAPWIRRFAAAAFQARREHASFGAAGAPFRRGLGALGSRKSAGRNCSSVTGTTRFRFGPKSRGTYAVPMRKKWHGSASRPGRCPPNSSRRCSAAPIRRPARGCGLRTQPTSIDPLEAVRALVAAALKCGATFRQIGREGARGRAATKSKS